MDNFIVSARKYRPRTFNEVIGQQTITTTLKNAIKNNKLAQAFLFCGPRGIGKTTCARIFAKTINCEHITKDIEPCDKCVSCISFNENTSFNIYELDAASNNSVDDIRNLVEQVRIPPQMGKYKVYIIDEVHMLSKSAFNAFLKTLEEPPDYAKFILATTEKHKIIPTILSRCQIFDFKRISVEDIAKHLKFIAKNENVNIEADAIHIIAQKADGALRDALSIFDQLVSFAGKNLTYKNVIENLNVLDYDYYFKLIDFFLKSDIYNSLLILNEIIDNGFDGKYFIIGLGEHLRNLLVCKDASTIKLLEVGESLRAKYFEQSSKCTVNFLLKALDINNECDINYKSSNDKRLHLELSIMRICSIMTDINKTNIKENAQFIMPAQKNITDREKKPLKPEHKIISSKNSQTSETKLNVDINSKAINNTPGTISIKQKIYSNNKEESKVNEPDIQTSKLAENFNQFQLEKVWNNFAETNSGKYPDLYSTLGSHKPLLKENFLIELKIDNKIQEEELNEKKIDILNYLRKELKNYKIQLKTVIVNNNKNLKPYSPEEKFKKMAESNPDIIKLKKQFDLDLDY